MNEYWNVKQEEDNYIQVTVYITDISKVNVQAIKDAVKQMHCKFHCDYSRF